mmetsp:Transcript_27017/g.74235  ORF Transcript_27017/g.74235 Transcript_27017/m.74235 type:complete len:121 (-) Transcript_27017:2662-3024(-)
MITNQQLDAWHKTVLRQVVSVKSCGGNSSGDGNSADGSTSGSNGEGFSGTIEDKKYPQSVYKTFSKEQRQELYELRQKTKQQSIQSTSSNPSEYNGAGAGNSYGPKGSGNGKNKGQTPKE